MNQSVPLIAILDDEEHIRRALRRLMTSAGLTARTFATGAEFLASLASQRPDCLVLDLHMPGVSGFEVQARLTSAGDRLPVVVITGHDTAETRQRVLSAGASAYLRKPVDDQELLDAVAVAMGRRHPE